MAQVDYTIQEISCRSCSNFCDVQVFTVEDEKAIAAPPAVDFSKSPAPAKQ